MNGKKAKTLNKLAAEFCDNVGYNKDTKYVAKTYTLHLPGLNAVGEYVVNEVKKVTIVLGDCQRKIYQQLKKGNK